MLTLGSSFSAPGGVAVDQNGNVFVAGVGNSVVEEIPAASHNFGSAPVGTATPVTYSLTFTFDTSGTVLAPSVVTQGITGLDFSNAGTGTCAAGAYSTSATCMVNVNFTPKASGVRLGAATLKNSSGKVIATAYLQGTGVGPQVTFSPPVQTNLAAASAHPMEWRSMPVATSSSPKPQTPTKSRKFSPLGGTPPSTFSGADSLNRLA